MSKALTYEELLEIGEGSQVYSINNIRNVGFSPGTLIIRAVTHPDPEDPHGGLKFVPTTEGLEHDDMAISFMPHIFYRTPEGARRAVLDKIQEIGLIRLDDLQREMETIRDTIAHVHTLFTDYMEIERGEPREEHWPIG